MARPLPSAIRGGTHSRCSGSLAVSKNPAIPLLRSATRDIGSGSKRVIFVPSAPMAYLLVLLALADTGPKESLPVITIQAN